MSGAKHTPAPWRVEVPPGPWSDFLDVLSESGAVVTMVWKADVAAGEADANARLIAAAPELLAALEALTYALNNEPEPTRRRLIDERTAARKAIADAYGGTQP